MARRQKIHAWKAEAFTSFVDRLRGFEAQLRGGNLLELRCGLEPGFGFLLDWLRPNRLVAINVERATRANKRPHAFHPDDEHDQPFGSFDAAFLLARDQLKRTLRRLSLPDVARVLAPGGLLVVTTLDTPARSLGHSAWTAELDRSAEAWSFLHGSLAGSGFEISEEHLGAGRLLVARRRES